MTTHAERMAERSARIQQLSAPRPDPRPRRVWPKVEGRALHHLERNGVAICGAYPTPHHIAGNEPECPRCQSWYRSLPIRPP